MASEVAVSQGQIQAPSRKRRLDWVMVVCAVFIITIVLVALLAPWIAPHSPDQLNILSSNEGPSAGHLLGTDELGRDLLSRLIWGARLSLLGPALIVLIETIVGTTLAIAAAWMGGWFDTVSSRVPRHPLRLPRPHLRHPRGGHLRPRSGGAGHCFVDRLHSLRRSRASQRRYA